MNTLTKQENVGTRRRQRKLPFLELSLGSRRSAYEEVMERDGFLTTAHGWNDNGRPCDEGCYI